MHLSLHHHPSYSLVAAEGELSAEAVHNLLGLLALVPVEQPLVVDLRRVASVGARAAGALVGELAPRSALTQVVAVVDDADVAAVLVMDDFDRWVPFVHHLDDAVSMVTGMVVVGR